MVLIDIAGLLRHALVVDDVLGHRQLRPSHDPAYQRRRYFYGQVGEIASSSRHRRRTEPHSQFTCFNHYTPSRDLLSASPSVTRPATTRRLIQSRPRSRQAPESPPRYAYAAAGLSVIVVSRGSQIMHDNSRLAFSRAARASAFATSSCSGIAWPEFGARNCR